MEENPTWSPKPSNGVRYSLGETTTWPPNDKGTFTLTRSRGQWSRTLALQLAEEANGMKRFRLRGSGGASGVNGATLWTKGQQAAQERDQWDGRARSQRPAEPMAAARRLPGGPTSGWRRGQRTGAGRKVRRLRGKMAAALALAAGLCVARRAVAVAGPRGAQVRSDRGSAEGVPRALPFSGPGVGVPSRGARGPAASRERSPDAGQGTAPLPWCKLRGCAVRSGWWAAVADALHRLGRRGRERSVDWLLPYKPT